MTNFEGAKAFRMSAEMELYTAVVTAGFGNFFYTTEKARIKRIRSLIAQVDAEFVAKLAVYVRTKMNMRSIGLVLVTELARIHNGDNLVSKTVTGVVQRADEITELLACYAASNQRKEFKKLNKLSKQIQKGLGESFNKFDEYQFAKYDRQTEITLRDALFLVRAKAESEEKQALFDKIAEQKLATAYTWETELSMLGQKQFESDKEKKAAFKAKWEELIASGKVGYMALMRNLRNILEAGVDAQTIQLVGERIASAREVERSKQLTFRYLSAYREVEKVKSTYCSFIMDCLEQAAIHSVENFKGFDLNTSVVIACDVSGSMFQTISKKSTIRLYEIGMVMGMVMNLKAKNVITGIFGDIWKTKSLSSRQILGNTRKLAKIQNKVGFATNGHKVIEYLIKNRLVVDKVMMFTDCQMWNTHHDAHINDLWKTYKSTIAADAKLYLFDLAGYGNTSLKTEANDVYLIAGWSDKIFDVLTALEAGESALSEINRIEL